MDKKNKIFPIMMIILLSIVGLVLLVVVIGEKLLSKDLIESYIGETSNIFSVEQKRDIEKYFMDNNVPSSFVKYLDENIEIKKLLEEVIFDIYDSCREGIELTVTEYVVVQKIKNVVGTYEEKENIQIWQFIEKDVKKIVSDIYNTYNADYVATLETVFAVFSRRTIAIVVVIFILLALSLIISRKIWGLLYVDIAIFITSIVGFYIINYNDFSNQYITINMMNNLIKQANMVIYQVLYIVFVLFVLSIMCFVVKPIVHKINIRIKAMRM